MDSRARSAAAPTPAPVLSAAQLDIRIPLTCPSAIAEGFSSNGAKVFITGRRADVLEKAAKELNGTAVARSSRTSNPFA
jgi:hypothetical protein